MKTVEDFAGIAYEAICAIEAAKAHCEEISDFLPTFALEKANSNIEILLQAIECSELVARQKVVDYAKDFEEYCDQCEPFSAEQFLMDFDEFKSKGECNGG